MAQYVTHISALRCGTGVPVGVYCWPGEDDALTVLQPRLPELGVLQLLEQGMPAREEPLVLSRSGQSSAVDRVPRYESCGRGLA